MSYGNFGYNYEGDSGEFLDWMYSGENNSEVILDDTLEQTLNNEYVSSVDAIESMNSFDCSCDCNSNCCTSNCCTSNCCTSNCCTSSCDCCDCCDSNCCCNNQRVDPAKANCPNDCQYYPDPTGLKCECNQCFGAEAIAECRRAMPKALPKKGKINVQSKLQCSDGEPLSGAPVELYKIDCNSGFELIDCKCTDKNGKVSFCCLDDGLYAVKQPLDLCYFIQPQYYPCYEVCISSKCKCANIFIINDVRKRENCNRPPIRYACKGCCC